MDSLKAHKKYIRANIYPEQKGIFIHIPKTAGTCINNYLKYTAPTMFLQHASAFFVYQAIRVRFPGAWDKLFKFAFVRNPWERAVSLYLFMQRKGFDGPFQKFLISNVYVFDYSLDIIYKGYLSQQSFICEPNTGEVMLDFVGRMETFDKDFDFVRKRLGLKPLGKYIKFNSQFKYAQNHNDYRTFYGEYEKKIVEERCQWEIERFGYVF